MINIIFIVSRLDKCGPENVVYDICSHLDRSLYIPHIITLMSESDKSNISNFRRLNIEIKQYDYSLLYLEIFPWLVAKNLSKYICGFENRIVHAHCYHPTLVLNHLTCGIRLTTIHNISCEDFVLKKGRMLGTYMALRFNNCVKNIENHVVISKFMQDFYSRFTKSVLIHNGVSEACKYKSLHNNSSVSKSEESLNIVVTGSITTRKNVAYIVDELHNVKRNYKCFILGEGPELILCKQIANEDDRIQFEGFKTNVYDYLLNADLYISASKSEGLPLSVLEALNMGVQVLLSSIPPHNEIVSLMDNPHVISFEPTKSNLVSFVERATSDYSKKEIKEKANILFGADSMTRKYENLYLELFEKSIR